MGKRTPEEFAVMADIALRGTTKKPKTMGAAGDKSHGDFQTDPAALDCLLPFLPREGTIWECAAGEGRLVKRLRDRGFRCFGTDIDPQYRKRNGVVSAPVDYLLNTPPGSWEVALTNPPYALKDQFLLRAYELGKAFALLLPLTTFDSAFRRVLFAKYGVEVVFPAGRTKFTTPGGKTGGAWFMSAWFTWKLGIGKELTFAEETRSNGRKVPVFRIPSKR